MHLLVSTHMFCSIQILFFHNCLKEQDIAIELEPRRGENAKVKSHMYNLILTLLTVKQFLARLESRDDKL